MQDIAGKIWKSLGPGYSERVYHNAFEVELRQRNISYETEKIIPVSYEGHTIGTLRADLVVAGDMVVELKSVSRLTEQFHIQIKNYMKLLDIKKGYLINFPVADNSEVEILIFHN